MKRADPKGTRLPIGRKRVGYREDPDPLFLTYRPKTRREFLNLLSWKGGKLGD